MGGGGIFEDQFLLQHAALVAKHVADFEVPDVTGFAEYTAANDPITPRCAASRSGKPGRLEIFRYPNGPEKTRDFAVADFADRLCLRLVGDDLAAPLSSLLSDRAFAPRPVAGKAPWEFEPGNAWGRFVKDANDACARHRKAIRTDIRKYYPSIKPAVLFDYISACVPDTVVRKLEQILAPWWSQGLQGLPIGPEISGIIGNALLERRSVRKLDHFDRLRRGDRLW